MWHQLEQVDTTCWGRLRQAGQVETGWDAGADSTLSPARNRDVVPFHRGDGHLPDRLKIEETEVEEKENQ